MTDIIFIGAGPVGLLGAIQLKLQYPEKRILMFEKYETPTRNHAMYVDQSSFVEMNRSCGFGDILDHVPTKVTISDLEHTLRAYASSIGIEIQFREIKDFNALKAEFPDTNYFIGSGGLKGIIHPQVFNNENQINETLRYAVEVKYKVEGETRALSKVTELPGVLANTNYVVSEYVAHLKNGLTPVSLRIFIDEETYPAMKDATFKVPYTRADDNRIPAKLRRTIQRYLSARQLMTGEMIQENSLKISTITLSIYASRQFCKQEDGTVIFQLGEEAFACPFYRGFNDNASLIPAFTKTMCALFEKRCIESERFVSSSSSWFSSSKSSARVEEPLDYYQRRIQGLVNSEIRTVAFLNSGIDMLESSIASSRYVPGIAGSTLSSTEGGRAFLEGMDQDEDERSEKTSSWNACVMS